MSAKTHGEFPTSAGILLGMGLGGFFDGIVLHQILQWHHMLTSAGFPPDTLQNLKLNTFFDGLFHASTWLFVVAALAVLWHHAKRVHMRWATRLIVGTVLMGFGIFNLAEGIIDHHILGLHHVNETVPPDQWIYWDLGFLASGAVFLAVGWGLKRSGAAATYRGAERRRQPAQPLAGGRRRGDPGPAAAA